MRSRIVIGLATAVVALGTQLVLADDWHENDRGRGHGYGHQYGRGPEYGRVVGIEPLVRRYRNDVAAERCWSDERYRDNYGYRDDYYPPPRLGRTGAAIAGGLAGAELGSQVAGTGDRALATVAGAAIGAALGHESARYGYDNYYGGGYYGYTTRGMPPVHNMERCRTVREPRYESRIMAYRVTYKYRGRNYVTDLPYDVGRRIRIGDRFRVG